jgi:hypothetical protein
MIRDFILIDVFVEYVYAHARHSGIHQYGKDVKRTTLLLFSHGPYE